MGEWGENYLCPLKRENRFMDKVVGPRIKKLFPYNAPCLNGGHSARHAIPYTLSPTP